MVVGELPALTLVFALTTNTFVLSQVADKTRSVSDIIQKMDTLRSDISGLSRTVQGLDDDVGQIMAAAEGCAIGLNDAYCPIADIDDVLSSKEWLRSKASPAKRSFMAVKRAEKIKRVMSNLYSKKTMLRLLNNFLRNMDRALKADRKRSCNLNLGFHCQTDEYADFADMYDFLNSALSPGKKKRDAPERVVAPHS